MQRLQSVHEELLQRPEMKWVSQNMLEPIKVLQVNPAEFNEKQPGSRGRRAAQQRNRTSDGWHNNRDHERHSFFHPLTLSLYSLSLPCSPSLSLPLFPPLFLSLSSLAQTEVSKLNQTEGSMVQAMGDVQRLGVQVAAMDESTRLAVTALKVGQ